MNRRKIVISVIIVAAAALVGARIIRTVLARQGTAAVAAAFPVEVLTVAPRDFDETLSLSGGMMAENQTDVPAKMPGKIIRYLFEEGSWVDKGQTIVTIDRDEVGVEFKETVVEAPIAGWLTRRYFDTGAHVAPGMPLAQIADYHRVKLVVSVPEADISRVRPGAAVAATFDAWPDRKFRGRVSRVSPTVDYLSRTVKAEIAIENPELRLRPGMYGRAEINVRHHSGAVVVPTTAILERETGTQVFVVEAGKAVARPVAVELDMGETSYLKSGLSFGDTLIVAGQHTVAAGSPVEIVGGK
ncbi:MAG: efflux RND transporter periplasmic adaptor subunit [Candidatus Edwardsbacteria bacterium]|jgi:multidrug efflux pump subunit AcrA (membrane-fusion protein)|nr:efflux RND transporter periplasmic adaptor subunit [Candidatus Edwardsbacteria bacterium]